MWQAEHGRPTAGQPNAKEPIWSMCRFAERSGRVVKQPRQLWAACGGILVMSPQSQTSLHYMIVKDLVFILTPYNVIL